MTITLTHEQSGALDQIVGWATKRSSRQFTLAGYAGTGKTTIMRTVIDRLPKDIEVVVAAPTGKAASVLCDKGVPATTIHRLCYQCRGEDENGKVMFDFMSHRVDREDLLVIVDEASMVDQRIYDDLKSTGCRLLFVGDHGQLAPVGKDPGLMANPDCRLETIMRQAESSPIVSFAHHLRNGGDPEEWNGGDQTDVTVVPERSWIAEFDKDIDVWLCGTNAIRTILNARKRGKADTEKIVVLRNDYRLQLMNGQTFTATSVERHPETGHPLTGVVDGRFVTFNDAAWLKQDYERPPWEDRRLLADYGHCLTVHKSQGSEWDTVGVYADRRGGDDLNRWRYTAATRAKSELVWVVPE